MGVCFFFFFNDTATTEIYTLSLHDALPIYLEADAFLSMPPSREEVMLLERHHLLTRGRHRRSEEHTSELQSRLHLVCRLLLEKKKDQHRHRADHAEAGVRDVQERGPG